MRRRHLGALVTLAIVLAACGEVGVGPFSAQDDDPVLQITSEGGFAPVEVILNVGPRYTVLGDGRLIFEGVHTLEYPGPLVPAYFAGRLDADQMDGLVELVDEMGLPNIEEEYDNTAADFVADATTEVVTYWDEGGQHRFGVYALGFNESLTGRSAVLQELVQTLDRYAAGVDDPQPYTSERVRLIAGPGFLDEEIADVREWPLDDTDFADWETLPNGWHCRVAGEEVLDSLADATQATVWEHPDEPDVLELAARPLHPGEPDCPS